MKRLSQSRNNAQLWMCLVVEVKFKAIKKDIEKKPGILGPCVCMLVAQSFSTLCDPMRPHSPSGSFVHGILQARILEGLPFPSPIRPMNQGKLEGIKQEMARVNIGILGISELKWNRMGEFNSDDHYVYFCSQESLGRNGAALIVKKGD